MILHGDCIDKLKTLDANSVDSLVTDPPAGISFMGKSWDDDKGGRDEWIKWLSDVMKEAMRVMKPGAHGLVWALPRTSHWTATALEDAGFEVRDCVYHFFGSGFPKSLDISKAIDKAAGAERVIIGKNPLASKQTGQKGTSSLEGHRNANLHVTAPATPEAKQWQGYGTALKPAVECWWLVRKPLSEKTVAKNVLKWGVGGLNIDGSRIGSEQIKQLTDVKALQKWKEQDGRNEKEVKNREVAFKSGRFPSHLVFSHTEYCTDEQCDIECAINTLDKQSGVTKSGGTGGGGKTFHGVEYLTPKTKCVPPNEGGASRFFYCAKVSSSERNAGLEDFKPNTERRNFSKGMKYKLQANGSKTSIEQVPRNNNHPTVKPQKLMQYLIKLVTPQGGKVLDPFMGSGSTGCAAKSLGFKFIGIEREKEYFEIAKKRMKHYEVAA